MKRSGSALTLFLGACALVSAQQQPDLQQLKSQYDDNVLLVEVEHAKNVAALLTSYTNELNALRIRIQQDGNLDKLRAVLAEITRAQTDRTLPASVLGVPEAAALAGACRQRAQELTSRRAETILANAGKYDNRLAALQKSLTQQGKVEEATAVEAERKRLRESDEVRVARNVLSDPTKSALPILPAPGRPTELTGQFHVHVDDSATIFVAGREVHRAALGRSVSAETTLRLGDCIAVNLNNKKSVRCFIVAFLTSDKKHVVNFRAEDFRILRDAKELNLTRAQFLGLKDAAVTDHSYAAAPFSFPTTSHWVWGQGQHCWLVAILTKEMIADQAP